jgi:hypothetical protein
MNKIWGQESTQFSINWDQPIQYGLEGAYTDEALHFEGAQYDFSNNELPFLFIELENSQGYIAGNASISEEMYTPLSEEELKAINSNQVEGELEWEIQNSQIRKERRNFLKLTPLRKNAAGQVEKLTAFSLNWSKERNAALGEKRGEKRNYASTSLLNSGTWYKIGVTEYGIYKLSYSFLKQLGIEVDNIDPRQLKLYGYGGGMLPERNDEPRPDDMQENSIVVAGEADGVFNKGDYVAFYGEGQVDWFYDSTRQMFRHKVNLYADTTFYFLTVSPGQGKRIELETRPAQTPSTTVTTYDAIGYHESDQSNLLKSGQLWVGELFDNVLGYNFVFEVPDIDANEQGKVELSVLARSGLVSRFTLGVNGQSFSTSVGSTNLNRYEFKYAQAARSFFDFTPGTGALQFSLTYNKPQSVARGWLNSLSFNVRRKLVYPSRQFFFFDSRTVDLDPVNPDYSEFLIQSARSIKIWDITDPYNIREKSSLKSNGQYSIIANTDILRSFYAFENYDTTHVFRKGKIANQNLHGLPQADLLIVSHPKFLSAAQRLRNFHEEKGLKTHIVTPQQIYNEFSSGAQDLVAIRSFIKMFYDRAVSTKDIPQYVTMLGDASYDYKDRISGNTNYVPAYQSANSLDPVNSYVSDDYFALLDDEEGEWVLNGTERMDIAIGRFPVKTLQEADGIVDKVVSYGDKNAMRDWRNTIVFVGDDEDGVVHMSQANDLSIIVKNLAKDFNTSKIFLDAYQQQSTASGSRYPQVNTAISRSVENGAVFLNYTGHGGETGWAYERVLTISDINSWQNRHNLPVFLTATCEFSRFDDPLRTSGGELVLLTSKGGGIGLMTTTRLVFSSPNYLLNRNFYDRVFERKSDGSVKTLGDIFLEVKNMNAYSNNSRNFSLLGDPAVVLAMPQHQVVTTSVNGSPVGTVDTLNALSKATITGYVADYNGNKLTNFNGTLYTTVFDKAKEEKTLNNDGGGVFTYEVQDSRLFKGKATVKNGDFSFSFIVPKDIAYNYGEGKLSFYSEDGKEDANGFFNDFIIGGSNPQAIADDKGPEMELYINDENFIYGGVTDANPVLLADLSDDFGINTVGSGIGHDLVAILDDDTENAFILNDYYEAEIDDYTKGRITFPFNDLPEGKHTLRVKAWDVANNSTEKTIEFTVVEAKEVQIDNLLNYPNPFTTNTEFIFQHNQAGVPMDVKLEIFTVSGKLVKAFNTVVVNEGFISRDIRWNGRDDFGDKIGKGVYVYKLKVRSRNGSTTEKFEKLVIL